MPLTIRGRALLACVLAGQAAESAWAPAEALEHYQRALELWDQAPQAAARSPLDRVELLHRAAEVANLAGQYDRAVTLVRLVLDEVDAAVEPLRAGALLERLALYHWVTGDTPGRWPPSSGRWPPSAPSRRRRSWPARWPRTASC
jgi:hypothetical protein